MFGKELCGIYVFFRFPTPCLLADELAEGLLAVGVGDNGYVGTGR
jgi:hypothetical protein